MVFCVKDGSVNPFSGLPAAQRKGINPEKDCSGQPDGGREIVLRCEDESADTPHN
jgi:hypothetical protein